MRNRDTAVKASCINASRQREKIADDDEGTHRDYGLSLSAENESLLRQEHLDVQLAFLADADSLHDVA